MTQYVMSIHLRNMTGEAFLGHHTRFFSGQIFVVLEFFFTFYPNLLAVRTVMFFFGRRYVKWMCNRR